jgi:hypothetical protein
MHVIFADLKSLLTLCTQQNAGVEDMALALANRTVLVNTGSPLLVPLLVRYTVAAPFVVLAGTIDTLQSELILV